ncbi:hypothetical protein Fmac_014273 [Flemingia macrophylla]|uniref:Uncharacterized protein n=1 Tax=Flemingia macrophylla TaxID=520843 RepID=A0ABD1MBB7_9FABA
MALPLAWRDDLEEGKIRDLMDVEDLLYYWKNLKCPVFIDLVCGFYVEICKDLFSSACEEGSSFQLMMAEN